MNRLFWSMALAAFVGCGEPTDDPEDCTQNEYFDDSKRLCETCPAVDEPECRDHCGYSIQKDDRGCPEAVCNNVCG